MAIITLTTDLGLKDLYVGALKGAILSLLPEAQIVDISHQIPLYNILDAGYILKNSYSGFPKGSIHIIGVKDEQVKEAPPVIVVANGHYFIGADNGIFSLLLDETPEMIYEIITDDTFVSTFPSKDIFAKVACHIAKGASIAEIAKPKNLLLERLPFRATSMDDQIRGMIVYIDTYGNAISNINKALFDQIGKGRSFKIEFARYDISKISKTYNDVPEGEILALFNSSMHLEVAMNLDQANKMLNIKLNDTINIFFQ